MVFSIFNPLRLRDDVSRGSMSMPIIDMLDSSSNSVVSTLGNECVRCKCWHTLPGECGGEFGGECSGSPKERAGGGISSSKNLLGDECALCNSL